MMILAVRRELCIEANVRVNELENSLKQHKLELDDRDNQIANLVREIESTPQQKQYQQESLRLRNLSVENHKLRSENKRAKHFIREMKNAIEHIQYEVNYDVNIQ